MLQDRVAVIDRSTKAASNVGLLYSQYCNFCPLVAKNKDGNGPYKMAKAKTLNSRLENSSPQING